MIYTRNDPTDLDIIYFAEHEMLLGQKLYPQQRIIVSDFWEHNYAKGVWAIGRRSGKSLMTSILALYAGIIKAPEYQRFLRPGEQFYVFCVANTAEQSKIILKMMKDLLTNSPYYKNWIVSDTASTLELLNGVIFKAIPCSARSARGYPCGVIIFDEAAHYLDTKGNAAGESLYAALSPSVAQFGDLGKILLISSPWTRAGLFWQQYSESLALGPDSGVQVLQIPTWEVNEGISRDFYDRERASDPELFDIEFGANFSEDRGYFIASWYIDHSVNTNRGILPPHRLWRGKYVLSLDPAKGGRDEYVACIGHYDDNKVFVVDLWHDFKANLKLENTSKKEVNITEVENWILEKHKEYGFKTVALDQYNSQGTIQRLNGKLPIKELTWTSTSKKQAFASLKESFIASKVEIYGEKRAIAQLKGLHVNYSTSGDWSVSGGSKAAVDDWAISLAGAHYLAKAQSSGMLGASRL